MKHYEKVSDNVSAIFLSKIIRINELEEFFDKLPFRIDYENGVSELKWDNREYEDRCINDFPLETTINGTKWLVKDSRGVFDMPDNIFKELYKEVKEVKEPTVITPKPQRRKRIETLSR